MRPDLASLERLATSPGPLQRLDPRAKVVATLALVALVVATPVGRPWWLALEGVLMIGLIVHSRIPFSYIFTRWLGFLVLVAFLAAMVAMGHPERARLGGWAVWGAILARNSLAFVAVLLLAATTPAPRLLGALGRLGVLAVLVATLHFMLRYFHVLFDELDRMTLARRSRTFRRAGRLDWGLLTGLVGMLLVRSLERGERVHAAMLARGWDGTIRGLDDPSDAGGEPPTLTLPHKGGGDQRGGPVPSSPSPLVGEGRVGGGATGGLATPGGPSTEVRAP